MGQQSSPPAPAANKRAASPPAIDQAAGPLDLFGACMGMVVGMWPDG